MLAVKSSKTGTANYLGPDFAPKQTIGDLAQASQLSGGSKPDSSG
jgi:hypothetical protein